MIWRSLVVSVLCCAVWWGSVARALAQPPSEPDSTRRALTVATTAYLVASVADEVSTAYALAPGSFITQNPDGTRSTVRTWEKNPLFHWGPRPLMHAVGVGVTAGTAYGLHHVLGRRHPRIATVALLGLAAARSIAAARNIQHGQRVRAVRAWAVSWQVLR